MVQSPVYKSNIAALVVDEAHCVKTWEDQFRQTFAQISDFRNLLPNEVKILAFTATATMDTYSVVKTRLGMVEPILKLMLPSGRIFFTMCVQKLNFNHF